jgi:hypothetical protein
MADKNPQDNPRSFYEEINVAGNQLIERLNALIQEGNIRRLIIKDGSGRTLLEVPLTLGVVAGTGVAVFAPFLAAIGAIAALVAQVKIVIERYEDPTDAAKEATRTVIEVKDEKEETKS